MQKQIEQLRKEKDDAIERERQRNSDAEAEFKVQMEKQEKELAQMRE